ncbi:MAG TPA: RluA family pseudouridine synthase [Planctomycetaceae bacterium]|jgi:23S rRNA pseudouridine1911/1915/1917 synthase|nr:RluA family pseudouridine synthase [Planctomycetaceae bacterium]
MTLNDGYTYRHVVTPEVAGHSTLSYIVGNFPHSTEAEWQGRLEAGEVLIDDQRASGPECLTPGSILIWNRPGWVEGETPQTYGLIYGDADILVVDKPGGLPTLPGGGFYRNTLWNFVRTDFADARPVHRLGRATSGLVLFALNSRAAAALGRRWPEVHKQYRALGSGVATLETYDIRVPIGPQQHPRLGHVHAASPTGKPAHSIARTLKRRESTTIFEVDLLTGRPHQIRIHLAAIGHPLEGDPLYATGGLPRADQPGLPGDSGYWLHARRLRFDHPTSGQPLEFTAPLPEILQCNCEEQGERGLGG